MFSSDDYIAIGADEEELGSQIEEDILHCTSVCSVPRVYFKIIDDAKINYLDLYIEYFKISFKTKITNSKQVQKCGV